MNASLRSVMSIIFDTLWVQDRLHEFKKVSDGFIQEAKEYAEDTATNLVIGLCIYILLCILMYFASVKIKVNSAYGQLQAAKRVLIVTAHPDDECMFFGPVIVTLTQRKDCQLFLLCLSNGNYQNQGSIRKNELYESCEVLGIPQENVLLIRSDNLPDNPSFRWREDVVANIVLNHIESLNIDTVITFDKSGVSQHLNHISIYYATAYLCMEKKLPDYCKIYALESISKVRKYSGILDVPVSYVFSTYWYIVSFKEKELIKTAMCAHKSQYVWFRKLYMIFSRYTFMNTLREVEIMDLELDLELDD